MWPRGGGAQRGPTRERRDGGLKGKEGSKAKRSKAKRSKAKRSKAKQSKAKRSEAKQSEAKQSEAKQSEAKQSKKQRGGRGNPKGLGWEAFQGPEWVDFAIRGCQQFEYIKSSFSLLENAISGPDPAGSLSKALNGWISLFGAADNSNT